MGIKLNYLVIAVESNSYFSRGARVSVGWLQDFLSICSAKLWAASLAQRQDEQGECKGGGEKKMSEVVKQSDPGLQE